MERRIAEEEPLTGIGTAAMAVPIPIVQGAGLAVAATGKALQASKQKNYDNRWRDVQNRESKRTENENTIKLEQQLAELAEKKKKRSVFGGAKGGKPTLGDILKKRLGVGGTPTIPMQPKRMNQPISPVNRGFSENVSGPQNTTPSVLESVITELPGYAQTVMGAYGKDGFPGGGDGKLPPMPNMRSKGGKLNYLQGGKIPGPGDGSGTDDKVPTQLGTAGGYIITKEKIPAAEEDGIMDAVGHTSNQIADVGQTTPAKSNAQVSKNEYYLTEAETQALTNVGVNLDKYAPNSDYKMNAATGGPPGNWLSQLDRLLTKRTAEGFKQKEYNEFVKDYRGDVPEGTVYDRDDLSSVPTIKDWYQSHDRRYNPESGEGTSFTRKGFKDSKMNLENVSKKYDKWMEENRPEAFNKFDGNEGDGVDPGGDSSGGGGGASANDPGASNESMISDFQDWNKKFSNLYDVMTVGKVAVEGAKLMSNIEQGFKGSSAKQMPQRDYPLPNLTGYKNELERNIGKVNTLTTANKTSDLASNMALQAGLKAQGLDMTRQATNEYIDKIEQGKIARHADQRATDKLNVDHDAKQQQFNDILSSQFEKDKGEAISGNIDAMTGSVESSMATKQGLKQSEVALEMALNTQQSAEAGAVYSTLQTELGEFFPEEWAGYPGMMYFIKNYSLLQEQIAKLRKMALESSKTKDPPATTPPDSE